MTLTFLDFLLLCAFGVIALIVVEISIWVRLTAFEHRLQIYFNRVVFHAESYDTALRELGSRVRSLEEWRHAQGGPPPSPLPTLPLIPADLYPPPDPRNRP